MGAISDRRAPLLLAAAILGAALGFVGLPAIAQAADPPVVISEFMAANDGTFVDSDGDASDWFELHNTTNASVNLAGWIVRDGSNTWEFPSVGIPAGGRRIVWASGKNRTSAGLHTNFKLSSGGEYFALIAPDGDVSAFGSEFPPQTSGISYGIASNGSVGYLATATPGTANSAISSAPVAAPVPNVGNSLQKSRFVEQLATTTDGATIRYTLDETEPTASSLVAQSGQVAITPTNQVTVLKAAAFLSNGSKSQVTTVVYVNPNATAALYGQDGAKMVAAVESLPVMTLRGAIDDTDIFQPVGFDMIDPDGPGFSIDAGAKVFGNWSLINGDKRNYRLKFSSQFGPTKLEYPLFDDFGGPVYEPADRFDQLELRGGSGDYDYRISNEFARQTILDMGTPSSHGRWVNLYVDGDYMGVFRLRERLNADWLSEYQGGSDDDYESVLRDYFYDTTSVNHGTGALMTAFDAATTYADVRDIIDPRAYVNAALSTWPQGTKKKELEWRFVGRQDPSHPLGAVMIPNDMDGTFRDNYYLPGFSRGMNEMIETFAADPEFKQIVLDQTAKAFCNNGPLTSNALLARLDDYVTELRPAFYGEDARFPDPPLEPGQTSKSFNLQVWEQSMTDMRTKLTDGPVVTKNGWAAVGLFDGCNLAPTIDVPTTTMAAVGETISMPIAVTDDSGATPTVNVTGLPAGLSYSNNRIVGTPTRSGTFETTIVATDGNQRFSTHRLSWNILPSSTAVTSVIVNEFNAVSLDSPWTGTDATLGSLNDNGGDWFELVVTEPTDMRGWTVELWDRGQKTGLLEQTDAITFSDNIALAQVAAGTIITVSEQQPDDPFRNPLANDWHLNANSSSAMLSDLITPASRTNFDTNGDGFRIVVRNAAGERVGPIMGETESVTAPVADGQVWMRCTEPATNPAQFRSLSTSSTFGEPNVCGAQRQTFTTLRSLPGDVDCSTVVDNQDVRGILKHDVDLVATVTSCSQVRPDESIRTEVGDVDTNGSVGLFDALLIARCLEGNPNALCPSR